MNSGVDVASLKGSIVPLSSVEGLRQARVCQPTGEVVAEPIRHADNGVFLPFHRDVVPGRDVREAQRPLTTSQSPFSAIMCSPVALVY